jgi:hypothetical protein
MEDKAPNGGRDQLQEEKENRAVRDHGHVASSKITERVLAASLATACGRTQAASTSAS